MLSVLLGRTPKIALLRAGAMIAVIALVDWRVEGDVPLGLPLLVSHDAGGQRALPLADRRAAVLCTWLTEMFDTFAWSPLPELAS